MRINQPELIIEGELARVCAPVEFRDGSRQLVWYSTDLQYADYLTVEKLDAFLLGLLNYAMQANEPIHLDGAVSAQLYYNLTHYYMSIIAHVDSSLQPVEILPRELDNGASVQTKGGVATGFSGGVDSFCVLADHFYSEVPSGYKLTHLIFNNVGAHGRGGHRLFDERYQRLLPLANELNLPLIKVDSNLHELAKKSFPLVDSPRNISCALLLQKLFGKYLYASSFRYEDCYVGPAYDLAFTDPLSVHLLSTETLECISSGGQYSRVEKLSRLVEVEPSHRYLDVCVGTKNAGNCSLCWKCARTLLTLELLGLVQPYSRVFHRERYRAIRDRFIVNMLSNNKDPLLKEVVRLAAERGYHFPLLARIKGACYRLLAPNKRFRVPRRIKRRLEQQ